MKRCFTFIILVLLTILICNDYNAKAVSTYTLVIEDIDSDTHYLDFASVTITSKENGTKVWSGIILNKSNCEYIPGGLGNTTFYTPFNISLPEGSYQITSKRHLNDGVNNRHGSLESSMEIQLTHNLSVSLYLVFTPTDKTTPDWQISLALTMNNYGILLLLTLIVPLAGCLLAQGVSRKFKKPILSIIAFIIPLIILLIFIFFINGIYSNNNLDLGYGRQDGLVLTIAGFLFSSSIGAFFLRREDLSLSEYPAACSGWDEKVVRV